MDGRCATCRWWESYGNAPERVAVRIWAGTREVVPRRDLIGWGDCTLLGGEHENGALLVIETDEDWRIRTRSDFGCIAWEAKVES